MLIPSQNTDYCAEGHEDLTAQQRRAGTKLTERSSLTPGMKELKVLGMLNIRFELLGTEQTKSEFHHKF